MRNLLVGMILGLSLAAGASFAVEGIDPFFDQIQRDNERFEQERERWDQRMFREEMRMQIPPPPLGPC